MNYIYIAFDYILNEKLHKQIIQMLEVFVKILLRNIGLRVYIPLLKVHQTPKVDALLSISH